MSAHTDKYRALYFRAGPAALRRIVAPLVERTLAALDAGDEHLNTIPLATWDGLALSGYSALGPCPCCGQKRPDPRFGPDWPGVALRETARKEPWRSAPAMSLAERVCLLKYTAALMASECGKP